MLGIAATEPGGEPTRLDPWRGKLAGDLLAAAAGPRSDAELGEALERWELSLFEDEPLRSERLREALAALLGGADGLWAAAMRAAVLVGEVAGPAARALVGGLRALARGEAPTRRPRTPCAAHFVESDARTRTATGCSRPSTTRCSGCAPRPAGYFSARASAA